VFLGALDPLRCVGGTDTDQDGLGDLCEERLAWEFAPQLRYWSGDNVGREPYWVARPAGVDEVLIGYLLSYYRDEGSATYICGLPFHHFSCDGHNGDSEAIFLNVYFDWSSRHWVLKIAFYSQHGDFGMYARGVDDAYPLQLYYPSHPGTYPRSYVSQGKHANYAGQQECNNGGVLGTDTCVQVNKVARVYAGLEVNLGSHAVHRTDQDCVVSRNTSYEYYGSGRQECYWTTTPSFRGWIPTTIGGAVAPPYSPMLQDWGF
jgi:hypothetical protein